MCGIAGLIGRSSESFIERVGPALIHRGPDDGGHWQYGDVCLVHRRLAILDLSPTGHQPMASPCGRWQLVFNGEIYNHAPLRAELLASGPFPFRGSSDTEVLLAWLIRHGAAGLHRLRGMFAFCLYDKQERTALLARDPHGIKPLYFWHGPGGELAFASELRALLASGLPSRQLNTAALAAFLATGSVPEPATLVAGIERLPAGCWAHWRAGQLKIEPWQPLPESLDPQATGAWEPAVAAATTREALESSVAAHLIADVPVGLFLSGGLDSGALLALAPRGLHTFTIGFAGAAASAGYDESSPAARLAAHFGAEHTPLTLSAEQARALLPEFLAAQDQPSNDGFNSWCVARLAREQGLKVALSGLGGDELFGGYPSFSAVPRLLRWRQGLGPAAPLVAKLLRRKRSHKAQRLAALLEAPPGLAAAYSSYRGLFSPREIAALLRHWGLDPELLAPELNPPSHLHALDQMAWLEGSRYLRQQLLPDADVMSMVHGLELRVPFVDAQLQQTLAVIPASQRLASGKALLAAAVPELPAWFSERPKQGFRFPFQLWLDDPSQPLPLELPPVPLGIDLHPWYRRWSLMVLQKYLGLLNIFL
jgi:asparagine synthase (glutamine-hydrolysing)